MDLSRNSLTGMTPGALGSLGSLEVLQMHVSIYYVVGDKRSIYIIVSLIDSIIG